MIRLKRDPGLSFGCTVPPASSWLTHWGGSQLPRPETAPGKVSHGRACHNYMGLKWTATPTQSSLQIRPQPRKQLDYSLLRREPGALVQQGLGF